MSDAVVTSDNTVMPEQKTRQVVLENGCYRLVVDAELGARITEFSINGRNCLTVSGPQIGSTFWPSPQEAWGWPPPAVLDSMPYAASQQADAWVFTSNPCPDTGLVLAKVVAPQPKGFTVTYKMHNPGEAPLRYAHWEISRIDGGLTFYRAKSAPLANSNLVVVAKGDVYWHDYTPAGEEQNLKLFANNSDGWLANLNNGLLLKKTFPTIAEADIAPNEAEVEIYAHGDPANPYIEIEQQGAYVEIGAGETKSWTVVWSLEEFANAGETLGSEELVVRAEAL